MALEQNQLYLPHPKHSPALYVAWKTAYLDTAQKIIAKGGLPLNPQEFLLEYEGYLNDFVW
jgi:hypothetical protein